MQPTRISSGGISRVSFSVSCIVVVGSSGSIGKGIAVVISFLSH